MIRAALADAQENGAMPPTPFQPSDARKKAIDKALGIETAAAKPLWHDAVLNARRQHEAEKAEVPEEVAEPPRASFKGVAADWFRANWRTMVATGVGIVAGALVVLAFG